MFPALQAARRELMTAANSTGRSGGGGRRQRHMRSGLVIAEVALSIVMLLAAGLLMRSFVKLAAVDPGIDPARILVAFADFAPGTYEAPGARQRFYRDAADRVREVHGIAAASLSSGLPPFGGRRLSVEAAGHPVEEQPGALLQLCDDTYFHTLGIALLSGRTIATTDLDGAHKVAVVNETFARRYFDANRALGATFRLPRLAAPPVAVPDPTFQIVGIVADVPNQGLRDAPIPQAYVPYTLFKNLSLMLIVRTAGNPTGFVGSVKQAMQAADRNVAIGPPQVFEDVLQRSFYAQPRFGVTVLGMFAVIGLALVALGIYGVLAYTVSQQAREIAIRMALGGDRGHVLRMVFRMGLRLLAAGLVVGLAASLATNRLLVSQLWNTSPYDAITMSTAVGIVILIGFCACWVPAHRALRVEPMTALRQE